MDGLKLESFFFSNNDYEYNQYLILAGIKVYRNEYRMNKIYPGLNELIKVNTLLEDLIKHENIFLKHDTPKYKYFEVYRSLLSNAPDDLIIPDSNFFFEMVKWSIPHIKEAIEEGIVLFDYVEKNIKIVPVSAWPNKKKSGYMLIPDNLEHKMHVHRFECTSSNQKKLSMFGFKTIYMKSTEYTDSLNSPEYIRKYFLQEYKELSNPTTYICETDLEFPYGESLFPVAKRKFMEEVTA